jgi:hypothetical protein
MVSAIRLESANTINNQLQTVAAGHETPAQIHQLITDIQNYNNFATQTKRKVGSSVLDLTASCWAGPCSPIRTMRFMG